MLLIQLEWRPTFTFVDYHIGNMILTIMLNYDPLPTDTFLIKHLHKVIKHKPNTSL